MKASCLRFAAAHLIGGLAVLELAATAAIAADPDLPESPGTQYTRKADVIYAREHGVALTMDVLIPPKVNHAAVIWVVSGGFHSHHSWIEGPQFARKMTVLLDRGYTVFAVVHGSVPKFTVPEYYAHVRRSIRFLRHHAKSYHVDPNRIGISGASAGGIISLMMGSASEEGDAKAKDPVEREPASVRAVGCFYPASDLLHFSKDGGSVIPVAARAGHLGAYRFCDLDPKMNAYVPISDEKRIRKLLAEYSPITHVSADDPPMLIVHGDADEVVPLRQASAMVEKLTSVGVDAKLVVAEGKGHGWGDMWANEMKHIADWFDVHLAAPR